MKRKPLKTIAKILAILAIFLILIVIIGPLLVPVKPLDGLGTPLQAAQDESQFITIPFEGTDGIDIHYLADDLSADDTEPTFVLLHGSLFNAFTWNEMISFFDERGQVIAYDQIPYGLSEKLTEGSWEDVNPYSSDAAVEQLFTFLDALAVDDVILVGNSYGGVLAVQAAQANPEKVEGLILIDAAVYVQEELPAGLLNLPQVTHLGPLFARQLGQSEAFIRQTYLNPDKITDDRLALTTIQTEVDEWDSALWEYLRVWSLNGTEYQSRIPDLQQPALVITGDSDVIVPVSDSERLNSELANSDYVVLPLCGHVPQEECPELLKTAVAQWLDQKLD